MLKHTSNVVSTAASLQITQNATTVQLNGNNNTLMYRIKQCNIQDNHRMPAVDNEQSTQNYSNTRPPTIGHNEVN